MRHGAQEAGCRPFEAKVTVIAERFRHERAAGARFAVGVVAAFALMLAFAGGAEAKVVHPPEGTFGSANQPTFPGPAALAVDPRNGDLLVATDFKYGSEGGRGMSYSLERFTATGEPAAFSALETNVIDGKAGPGGEPCAVEPASCDETPGDAGILSTEGYSPDEMEIAVAPAGSAGGTEGDIYVTDAYNSGVVDVFAPTGEYVGQISGGYTCGVAVGPSGDVYVGEWASHLGKVRKYVPSSPGDFEAPPKEYDAPSPCQVAAGAASTEGYVFAEKLGGALGWISGPGVVKIHSEGPEEGEIQYEFGGVHRRLLASNLASGEVYDALTSPEAHVSAFDASGQTEPVEESTIPTATIPQGIAIDPSSGRVYVAREGHSTVEMFGPAVVPPEVTTGAAEAVTTTSAIVHGEINPRSGPDTTCVFEYTPTDRFETEGYAGAGSAPCVPGGPFADATAHAVAAQLTGLRPGFEYSYRLVGTNAAAATAAASSQTFTALPGPLPPGTPSGSCLNERFRLGGPGAALPDCRAYEQSTAIDKNGGEPAGFPGSVQVTETPEGITFYSQAGVPGGVGAQDYPTFLSSRGEAGWSTQGLLPPASLGLKASYLGLTPGGGYAITQAVTYGPGAELGATALYERSLTTGAMTTIVSYDPECSREGVVQRTGSSCFGLAGATADGSRVFIETEVPLTKGQPGEATPLGQPNLFVWDRSSGRISLVDVNEAGEPLPEGGFAGPYRWNAEPPSPLEGGSITGMYVGAVNAISRDGSEAFYTERGEAEGHGQLYVRAGLGVPAPRSIKVSAYQEGREGPELRAAFLEASPDGRFVFFKSSADLTGDAYAGEEGEESESLYRYDVFTGRLIDLTPDEAEARPSGPGVQGLLGASESGETAYFVATAVLTSQPGPRGQSAEPGMANLYRWEAGSSPALAFVATLQGGDPEHSGQNDSADWSPQNKYSNGYQFPKTARVSADGASVVFSSRRALTGAQNRAVQCSHGAGTPAPCAELFRYAAAAKTLDCISCNPGGTRPLGSATFGTSLIHAADTPEISPAPVLPKNLSADGDRFFFQTPDRLVTGDLNSAAGCQFRPESAGQEEEQATCMDVYEWEAVGTPGGSCTSAEANGGCLYLISSGQGDEASYFAGADREGANVYFFTSSQLVPVDRDHLYDIYDARVGGGLPSQHELPTAPCGSRQECVGSQATPESSTPPGSSSFHGQGNVTPRAKCRKGFFRRHGKCVKKHHKKHHRKHHRRHHHGKRHRSSGKRHRQRMHGNGRRGQRGKAHTHRRANVNRGGSK